MRKSGRNAQADRPMALALSRFRRELDRRVTEALRYGPILIIRRKRPAIVLMSLDDYWASLRSGSARTDGSDSGRSRRRHSSRRPRAAAVAIHPNELEHRPSALGILVHSSART